MLRNAVRPRWLLLLALVLAVCVLFGWLGSWQLGIARDKGAERARRAVAQAPRAPVEQVLQPQQGFPAAAVGRRITARGEYDASRQVLVTDRLQNDKRGWWVVTALRTQDDAWLPVVRGWVPAPDDPAASPARVPSGTVVVEGLLQPDEAPLDLGPTQPPDGLGAVDAAELVNLWGAPIYNGYVVLTGERTAQAGAPQPERVPPPVQAAAGLVWRNAAYAVQWWVFAAFALVLWGKMVAQDARERSAADDAAAADAAARGAAARDDAARADAVRDDAVRDDEGVTA